MTKSQRTPTFAGCRKAVIGGHAKIAWTCRGCGKLACASCVHHYHASTRSEFTLKDAGDRQFTCDSCLRKERSLKQIEAYTGKRLTLGALDQIATLLGDVRAEGRDGE